jgi:hypothetical protein
MVATIFRQANPREEWHSTAQGMNAFRQQRGFAFRQRLP